MKIIFSTKLESQFLKLSDAASIAMTSFISQKSLSYLDLQLSEHALAKRRERVLAEYFISPSFFQKTFFSSEENLRNCLIPERKLLYCLHLDLPVKREYNILTYRNYHVSSFNGFISCYVDVSINVHFYNSVVCRLTETAFYRTNDKLRLLKWIADLGEVPAYPTYYLRRDVQLYFLNQLYPECKDSNFVTKCVLIIMGYHKVLRTDQPEMLDFFLDHFFKSDYYPKTMWMRESFANECIYYGWYRNLRPVLKYEDQPYFEEGMYENYRYLTGRNRNFAATRNTESKMSRERCNKLFQIILFFDRRDGDFGNRFLDSFNPKKYAPLEISKALCLLWNTIPDAYVTLEEMQDFYGLASGLKSDEIGDVHTYYEEAICQSVSCLEPRKLMHYCKTCIRHILYENNHWLPEGIGQLKIPPKLHDYLNLKF